MRMRGHNWGRDTLHPGFSEGSAGGSPAPLSTEPLGKCVQGAVKVGALGVETLGAEQGQIQLWDPAPSPGLA